MLENFQQKSQVVDALRVLPFAATTKAGNVEKSTGA